MVHQFKNNGYNIVIDVYSGAIHVVDDLVYKMIEYFNENYKGKVPEFSSLAAYIKAEEKAAGEGKKASESDIREAYDEVCELIANEQLFSEDKYEPLIHIFNQRPIVLKALCLHIAHDCNLACEYCFAGKGEYNGARSMMSFETGKKAIDYMVEHSGTRNHLEVDFFGGEPTMNFGVVKELVRYARSIEKDKGKTFRFTLTTNGLLANKDIIDFADKEMSNVVMSIDGRKEVTDRARKLKGGNKSPYDIIMPKFKEWADKRGQKNYYVRGTFTHNNLDFSKDVLHLADEGFKEISVEPVVASPDEQYALKEEDLKVLLDEYDFLAQEIVKRKAEGRGFDFFHFMIDLEGGPCASKRLQGCGAGCEYLAVTPEGDFYPCHQFVGNEAMKIGDVDRGIVNDELRQVFHASNVYTRPACKDCFAKFYCSGGCAANAYNFTGSIDGNYELGCILEKKRVECSLMIKAAEAEMKEA